MITSYKIDWKVPDNIEFFISTNQSGFSKEKFEYANFSFDVGDNQINVQSNINCLKKQLNINHVVFMNQTHSDIVSNVSIDSKCVDSDAIFSNDKRIACAVLTADCIPILITNKTGSIIGCIHAGWKGLKDNIIEKSFNKLSNIKREEVMVLLGPCISQKYYEVDGDVLNHFPKYSKRFKKIKTGKYKMNLRYIAYDILSDIGITDVTISKSCTFDENFYSYRKDGITGRFVSLIWFKNASR